MPSACRDHAEEGEERWKTVGMPAGVVLLLVVHTHREEGGEEYIRIISADEMTASAPSTE
jgi:uncharacterized DUF497 family protein